MKHHTIFLFLFSISTSLLYGQAPTEPIYSLSEGTRINWQTTAVTLTEVFNQLNLQDVDTYQQWVPSESTTCDIFYVNGSPVGGEHFTVANKEGKAVTIWLSTFKTTWVQCPEGKCKQFEGRWAGITVGKLKKS